jgi:hypothetical protein
MIKKIVFLVSIILGFIFISCENNVTDPGKSGPMVRFSIEKSGHSNHGISFLNGALTSNQLNPAKLLKTTGYDELRIICLDMTKYSSWNDFLTFWSSSSQNSLIDYTLWDSTKDVFDNFILILKKYPGNAYDYMGDYSFSIKDSIAKGTVYLNPGINDFIYALRLNGKTIGNIGETQAVITKDSVNTIVLNSATGTGSLSGYIKDATNNNFLAGASVGLKLNTTTIGTMNSGSSGYYSFSGLDAGDYILTASQTGYITATYPVSLVTGENKPFDISIAPQSSSIQYRIVVTWGSTPSDLDAHLKKGSFDIYFNNRGSVTSPPYAILDVDETNGFGPETISIYNLNNDTCKYYVHNYSGETDIIQSQAQVKVYSGSALLKSYSVPLSGSGLYWYVFDINPSGTITDRNFITPTQPSLSKFSLKVNK